MHIICVGTLLRRKEEALFADSYSCHTPVIDPGDESQQDSD